VEPLGAQLVDDVSDAHQASVAPANPGARDLVDGHPGHAAPPATPARPLERALKRASAGTVQRIRPSRPRVDELRGPCWPRAQPSGGLRWPEHMPSSRALRSVQFEGRTLRRSLGRSAPGQGGTLPRRHLVSPGREEAALRETGERVSGPRAAPSDEAALRAIPVCGPRCGGGAIRGTRPGRVEQAGALVGALGDRRARATLDCEIPGNPATALGRRP